MVHVENVIKRGIHQQKNCDARERRANHGAGQVLRGIRVFFNKIDRRVPAVVGNNNALQGEHQSQKDAVRMDEGRVVGEQRGSSGLDGNRESGDDDRDQTESFNRTGDLLRTAAGLEAYPIKNGERSQRKDPQEPYMSGEHGQKFSGEFRESDGQGGVGDRLDGEVAAADNESGLFPQKRGASKRTTRPHGEACNQAR